MDKRIGYGTSVLWDIEEKEEEEELLFLLGVNIVDMETTFEWIFRSRFCVVTLKTRQFLAQLACVFSCLSCNFT